LRERYPTLPYTVAGFSFGSRIALRIGASEMDQAPRRVIAVGHPVRYFATEHYGPSPVARQFVLSTNDEFAPLDAFQPHYLRLPEPKSLTLIESRDHFFAGALEELEAAIKRL
jgi:alpha/beta superfamily hydrolase